MFEEFAERICLECVNSEDGCTPDNSGTCPFWGEFDTLAKLCETAEELASSIGKSALEDYYTDREYAVRAENW